MSRHVVIWGCPRSGTSIFFELFSSHPDYVFYFEPLTDWMASFDLKYPTVVKNPFTPVGNTPGLSGDLDTVLKCLPDAVHFWVVRHPYDAVTSLAGRNHPPELPARWEGKPPLMRSAALWRYWNEEGRDALISKGVELTRITFEDLVTDTASTVSRALDWAEAPCTPEIEAYERRVTAVATPETYRAQFQKQFQREGTYARVGRGREELGPLDLATIANIVGEVPHRFGYQL